MTVEARAQISRVEARSLWGMGIFIVLLHVVGENERVFAGVEALEPGSASGDFRQELLGGGEVLGGGPYARGEAQAGGSAHRSGP